MSDRRLKTRAVLSTWFEVAVVVLVVVALVGGWATYTAHVNPGTTTEERVVSEWGVNGDFAHGAAVTTANPVYPVGTRLSDRSTYFTGIAPELDGQFLTQVNAASANNLSISLDTSLILQSAGEDQVYWQVSQDLEEQTAQGVAPGSPVTVPFAVNVTQVDNRLERISETLGGSPAEPTAFIAVDVSVQGSINGQPQSASFTEQLTITPSGGTYSVAEPQEIGEQFQRTQTVTVPEEYGPLRTLGGPLAALIGLGGLGTLAVAYRRDELTLSETETALLEYRSDRTEFDEWITQIRLPDVAFEKPEAEAESLRDLVDFAIDTDSGVIESPDDSIYYVVSDDYLYVYRPPKPADVGSDALSADSAERDESVVDGDEGAVVDEDLPLTEVSSEENAE